MTLADLYTILAATKLPVAYNAFPDDEKVGPPCITYEAAYTSNFGADNYVYSPWLNVDIFLYLRQKGTEEATLESQLNANKIFWNKTETYNNDEKVYQIIYEVKINAC